MGVRDSCVMCCMRWRVVPCCGRVCLKLFVCFVWFIVRCRMAFVCVLD